MGTAQNGDGCFVSLGANLAWLPLHFTMMQDLHEMMKELRELAAMAEGLAMHSRCLS